MRTGINLKRFFFKNCMYSKNSSLSNEGNGHRNRSGGFKVLMRVK